MSHPLPDDESEWPRDPWRVLGVTRDDDERTVRRAYAALIRRFKPETFPAQFQRIRQVYETVKAWNEQQQLRAAIDQESTDVVRDPSPLRPADVARPEQSDSDHSEALDHQPHDSSPVSLPELAPNRDDWVDEAWRIAIDRSIEEAAALLSQPEPQASADPDIRLLRYWLKRLAKATPATERDEPLFTASTRTLQHPSWLAAYTLALRSHAAARGKHCLEVLLNTSVGSSGQLARLRWKSLAATGRWWEIDDDLVKLLAGCTSPVVAAQLVLVVADLRVWETSDYHQNFWENLSPQMDEWLNEVRSAQWLGDRWDVLLQLRHDCTRMSLSTDFALEVQPIHRLLRALATAPPREARQQLARELMKWREAPGESWRRLTVIQKETPTLFFELAQQLSGRSWRSRSLAISAARLAQIFDDQLDAITLWQLRDDVPLPPEIAMAVYEFCRRNSCSLSALLQAIPLSRNAPSMMLAQLRRAPALELLIEGCHLFWEL